MTKARMVPVSLAAAACRWRLAAAFSVAAVTFAAGPGIWMPVCDETRTGSYTFENLGGSGAQAVKIYLCPEVTCASRTDFATASADSYSAPSPHGLARPYFMIERNANGVRDSRIIGARRLALEGAYNFRDLGGMQTTGGKTVRWGQVFRSDTLTKLTNADYERLNAIGISLVCDLRTRQERQTDPTDWRNGSPVFVLAPVSENENGASLDGGFMTQLLSSGLSVEDGRKLFEQFYVHMAFDSASKFGSALRAIATSDKPSMFHCTGGRDRTGITAAMLLTILEVPRDTIVSDFVLSTKYLSERPNASFAPAGLGPEQARVFGEIIELQPRYIEAIFRAIDQRYGGFDRYRAEALHIPDAEVAALRSKLLN